MEEKQTLKSVIGNTQDAQELIESTEPEQYKLVGTVLGDKIRIDSVIGQGGMSIVYKGTHLVLNRSRN